jgi:hypothetical protein
MDRGVALALWGLEQYPGQDMLLVDASQLGAMRAVLHDIDEHQADSLRLLLDQWQQSGQVQARSPLTAASFPRAAYRGLPAELAGRAKPGSSIRRSMSEALELAERLGTHLEGDLRPYTAEQHRRAIEGLTARLKAQLNTGDTEPAGR